MSRHRKDVVEPLTLEEKRDIERIVRSARKSLDAIVRQLEEIPEPLGEYLDGQVDATIESARDTGRLAGGILSRMGIRP